MIDVSDATTVAGEAVSALHNDALRQLLAALPQFAFVLDRNLRVLIANRGVGKRSPQQLEGLSITDFFPVRPARRGSREPASRARDRADRRL